MVAEDRRFPLAARDNDARFTFGLVLDIASVIEGRGYPEVTANDLVELRQALFGFLYRTAAGDL